MGAALEASSRCDITGGYIEAARYCGPSIVDTADITVL